jgi:hypothetical protein
VEGVSGPNGCGVVAMGTTSQLHQCKTSKEMQNACIKLYVMVHETETKCVYEFRLLGCRNIEDCRSGDARNNIQLNRKGISLRKNEADIMPPNALITYKSANNAI